MSEITRGAIGMPFEMAMSSALSRRQFHSIAQALLAERDQLKAENEALRKDADRLRWLRQYEFDIGSYHGVHEHNAAAWFEHISDADIDSMIADEAQFAKESGHD